MDNRSLFWIAWHRAGPTELCDVLKVNESQPRLQICISTDYSADPWIWRFISLKDNKGFFGWFRVLKNRFSELFNDTLTHYTISCCHLLALRCNLPKKSQIHCTINHVIAQNIFTVLSGPIPKPMSHKKNLAILRINNFILSLMLNFTSTCLNCKQCGRKLWVKLFRRTIKTTYIKLEDIKPIYFFLWPLYANSLQTHWI